MALCYDELQQVLAEAKQEAATGTATSQHAAGSAGETDHAVPTAAEMLQQAEHDMGSDAMEDDDFPVDEDHGPDAMLAAERAVRVFEQQAREQAAVLAKKRSEYHVASRKLKRFKDSNGEAAKNLEQSAVEVAEALVPPG